MVKIKLGIDKLLEWLLVFLMGISVVNVLWQVFTRFILNNPSSFTEELARYLLIWVGLLGASYCVGRKLHLAIDLLPLKLEGRRRQYLEVFIQTTTFLFSLVVMVIGGIELVSITLLLEQTSAALQWKLGYVYLVIPFSGALMMFYALYNGIEALRVPGGGGGEHPGGRAPAAID